MGTNRFPKFNDGEGFEYTDFDAIARMARKPWGYGPYRQMADIVSMIANGSTGTRPPGDDTAYPFAPGYPASIGWGVYPVFGAASLTGALAPGAILVDRMWYDGGGGGGPDALDDDQPVVEPIELAGQSLAIGANASGSTRYDILTVPWNSTLESNGDNETRDFEDGTTRAKSTQSMPKRQQILSAGTLTLTQGTPGAGVPSPPSGHLILFVIEVINGATNIAIDKVTDRTIPVARGGLHFVHQFGNQAAHNFGGANGSFGIASTSAGRVAIFRPPAFGADPAARLLGVAIHHAADEAWTANIRREKYHSPAAASTLLAVSPIGTTDGQYRTVMESPALDAPIWMNGYPGGRAAAMRGAFPGDTLDLTGVSLEITSGASSGGQATIIQAVTWIIAA